MWSLRRSCAKVCKASELRFRVVRRVSRGIDALDRIDVVQDGGQDWGGLFPIFTAGFLTGSLMEKCFLIHLENLIRFPFGKYIIGKLYSLAF